MHEERLARIRELLRMHRLDGWLFTGGRTPDPALAGVFRLGPPSPATRPHAYFVPADGEPVKIVHAIEPAPLEALPGAVWTYPTRDHWERALAGLFERGGRVAVQYSPRAALPPVDGVPAGLMELLRACGARPESSAPLLALLAALSPAELASHETAAGLLTGAVREMFTWLRERLRGGGGTTELAAQARLAELVRAAGLALPAAPIVAFGEHTTDPHYAPVPSTDAPLSPHELVLVDAWARLPRDGAPFADITWMGVTWEEPPHEWAQMFEILCRARDHGVEAVRHAAAAGKPVAGAQVDRVVRGVIEAQGYGDFFLHRTGHSLGAEVHGLGVNLDGVEAPDERDIPPGAVFTIEPGVYFPGRFGMRTEVDVALLPGEARVTTVPFQTELLLLG